MNNAESPDAWLLALFDHIDAVEQPAPVAVATPAPSPAAPVIKRCACDRCGGTGVISQFRHRSGGECFKCRGAGYIHP